MHDVAEVAWRCAISKGDVSHEKILGSGEEHPAFSTSYQYCFADSLDIGRSTLCFRVAQCCVYAAVFQYVFLDTEIDWVAYMQQSEIFLNGTRDYDQLIGQTGPCV